ncbi:hypothetical protein PG991_003755 [Apiospora marii]|uniref:Allergen n=1 Tax=Apiospora marii TaxID=335849 RepID=A0ABR1S626_9PEZI
MEKAKQAIRDFTSKSGHHDTTVHSATAPSVEHEAVKPQQHENINTAIDREVHQDHYHQTVQPVEAHEVLPEQHHHKLGGVEHREFDHRNNEETRRRLAAETEGFHDERVVHDTTRTKAHAPVVEGEHVHHHLHETIQPVVHKETIEPHVVHTTVPIHETHHNKAQHHQTTTLPAVNMSDWQSQGGLLHGRDERYDNFEGQPEDVGGLGKVLHRSHESDKDPVERHTFHGDFNEEGGREGHHAKQYSGRTGAGDNVTSSSTTGTGSRMGMGTSSTSKMGTTTSSTGRTAMVDEGMTGSRNPMSSGASTTSRESGVTGSTGGAAASAAAMAMRGNRGDTTTGTTQSGRMAGSGAPSGLGPLAGRTTGGSGATSGMTGNMPAASDMGSSTTSSTTGAGTGARHNRADSGKGFADEDTYGGTRKPGAFDSTRAGERGGTDKMGSSHDETGRKKSGLLDRLNPMTDSTGDGQAGFMK